MVELREELVRHFMRMQEKLIDRFCDVDRRAGGCLERKANHPDVKLKHIFPSTLGESDAERDYRRSTGTLASIRKTDETERKLAEVERDLEREEILREIAVGETEFLGCGDLTRANNTNQHEFTIHIRDVHRIEQANSYEARKSATRYAIGLLDRSSARMKDLLKRLNMGAEDPEDVPVEAMSKSEVRKNQD